MAPQTRGLSKSSLERTRGVHRLLDNIPIRNGPGAPIPSPGVEHRPKYGRDDDSGHTHGDNSVSNRAIASDPKAGLSSGSGAFSDDEESFSPTGSELDALEELFFEYETQSSSVTVICSSQSAPQDQSMKSTTSCAPKASKRLANELANNTPSDTQCDPLQDHLRLIWRKWEQVVMYGESLSDDHI